MTIAHKNEAHVMSYLNVYEFHTQKYLIPERKRPLTLAEPTKQHGIFFGCRCHMELKRKKRRKSGYTLILFTDPTLIILMGKIGSFKFNSHEAFFLKWVNKN